MYCHQVNCKCGYWCKIWLIKNTFFRIWDLKISSSNISAHMAVQLLNRQKQQDHVKKSGIEFTNLQIRSVIICLFAAELYEICTASPLPCVLPGSREPAYRVPQREWLFSQYSGLLNFVLWSVNLGTNNNIVVGRHKAVDWILQALGNCKI